MCILRLVKGTCIRKTGNLLFLLEKAEKAGISGDKHRKRAIIKQCPFSKASRPRFYVKCFPCLTKQTKARKTTSRVLRWCSRVRLSRRLGLVKRHETENVTEACIKRTQDAGGVLRGKRDGRRSRRGDDRRGKIDGEHGVGCPHGNVLKSSRG